VLTILASGFCPLSSVTPSFTRNKQIASVFKDAGIIEKYGSGIKRVRLLMREAGAAEPMFELVGCFFKVTIFPIDGGVGGGVGGGVNKLLDYICAHPGEKTTVLRQELGFSQRTLERHLQQLRNTGKIEFRGTPKTGGYFPIEG